MAIDTDVTHLHPLIRGKLPDLESRLRDAGIPLRLHEGGRTPARQAALYAIGRARGNGQPGRTVTRAKAWDSKHPFGCAVDYVFWIDGRWTWDEPDAGMWVAYQRIGADLGLQALSFEKPHLELPIALSELHAGRYPDGGDASWRAFLDTNIEQWGPDARLVGDVWHPGAPPLAVERPAEVAA